MEGTTGPVSLEGITRGDEEKAGVDLPDRMAVDPQKRLEIIATAGEIARELSNLSRNHQEVFIASVVRGETFLSIANRLGITEGRACQLYWQAVGRIQLIMGVRVTKPNY